MKALAFFASIVLVNIYLSFSQEASRKEVVHQDDDMINYLEARASKDQQSPSQEGDLELPIHTSFLNTLYSGETSRIDAAPVGESMASTKNIWKTVLFIGIVVIFY